MTDTEEKLTRFRRDVVEPLLQSAVAARGLSLPLIPTEADVISDRHERPTPYGVEYSNSRSFRGGDGKVYAMRVRITQVPTDLEACVELIRHERGDPCGISGVRRVGAVISNTDAMLLNLDDSTNSVLGLERLVSRVLDSLPATP